MRTVFVLLLMIASTLEAAVTTEFRTEDSRDIVRVTGLTPGGLVALSVISLQANNYLTRHLVQHVMAYADRKGSAEVYWTAVPRAIWVVVDVTKGEVSVSGPAAFDLGRDSAPEIPLPVANASGLPQLRLVTHNVEVDCFYQVGSDLVMLLVRPGVWAWELTTQDGDLPDDDHQVNRTIKTCMSSFTPVPSSPVANPDDGGPIYLCPGGPDPELLCPVAPSGPPAPNTFLHGDVLIGVNPMRMSYYTREINVTE